LELFPWGQLAAVMDKIVGCQSSSERKHKIESMSQNIRDIVKVFVIKTHRQLGWL
jgi:hypothetical protein